jgi:hypothetical protein
MAMPATNHDLIPVPSVSRIVARLLVSRALSGRWLVRSSALHERIYSRPDSVDRSGVHPERITGRPANAALNASSAVCPCRRAERRSSLDFVHHGLVRSGTGCGSISADLGYASARKPPACWGRIWVGMVSYSGGGKLPRVSLAGAAEARGPAG